MSRIRDTFIREVSATWYAYGRMDAGADIRSRDCTAFGMWAADQYGQGGGFAPSVQEQWKLWLAEGVRTGAWPAHVAEEASK